MYPLTAWSYEHLCNRLDHLESQAFHPELVVVSSQLIEQIIRRHLARELNLQRRCWNKEYKDWIVLACASERDQVLRA
ncbi:MAG: hypothetical protein EOM24_16180 [Chloroflexia bacterium]|nr:hypothetical protein [Chloroflexia bacterium]